MAVRYADDKIRTAMEVKWQHVAVVVRSIHLAAGPVAPPSDDEDPIAETPAAMLPAAAGPTHRFKLFPVRRGKTASLLRRALGQPAAPAAEAEPEPESMAFDMTTIPWLIPGSSTGRLHFLWHEGGPPLCRRKQADGSRFKTCLISGSGLVSEKQRPSSVRFMRGPMPHFCG